MRHEPQHQVISESWSSQAHPSLRAEIKAYEFYDKALQSIQDPTVRKMIKELRDEEAEHQRLLNEQKAKYPDTMEPDLDPDDADMSSL